MKRGKKAQFYLIAAGVIIFILVSLAVVTNYVSMKKEPQKFYDIGDVLKREGPAVVANAINTNVDVSTNIQKYLQLYQDYLNKNVNTDFDLIIFYGNIKNGTITAERFTRASLGELTINFGTTQYTTGGTDVVIDKSEWKVEQNLGKSTINVTLTSNRTGDTRVIEVPVLSGNNFAFVMTGNDEFNNYIRTSSSE